LTYDQNNNNNNAAYIHALLKKNLGHGIPNKGFKKIEIAKTNADSRSNSKRCPI